ncbi:MAG: hypothetical protein ACYS7M_07215, partial [Planctomycetota bacterium]
EFFSVGSDGKAQLLCDPLSTIKEPECLAKWQFVKLDAMVQAYMATVEMYRRLAPLQERMFRHMQRELDETEEADAWKFGAEDDEDEGDDDESPSDDDIRY